MCFVHRVLQTVFSLRNESLIAISCKLAAAARCFISWLEADVIWLGAEVIWLGADTILCNICLTMQYLNETLKNYDRLSKSSAVLQDHNLKQYWCLFSGFCDAEDED